METVNLLIKPASGLCNLRCRYCFYEDVSSLREQKSYGIMTEETTEALVKRIFEQPRNRISIGFQGGEPTIAGLDFFQRFTALADRYNTRHVPISWSIQTNGTLLNEEWARFFAQHRFLVGLSLDGPAAEHNALRVDPDGKGTFQRVMHAAAMLQSYGVEFNILCVVTGYTARHGRKLYQFFRSRGFDFLQFIPCLDPLEAERGSLKFSLTPEKYAIFLCDVFDCWFRDWLQGNYASVRLFDDYVHLLCGQPAGTCASSGACGQYFVVEADGGVYPCDFFVLDEWRMGSIRESSFEELAASEPALRFLKESHERNPDCADCPYQFICRGGCRRDRQEQADRANYYCPAFRRFFDYALPRLKQIAREELRAMRASGR